MNFCAQLGTPYSESHTGLWWYQLIWLEPFKSRNYCVAAGSVLERVWYFYFVQIHCNWNKLINIYARHSHILMGRSYGDILLLSIQIFFSHRLCLSCQCYSIGWLSVFSLSSNFIRIYVDVCVCAVHVSTINAMSFLMLLSSLTNSID